MKRTNFKAMAKPHRAEALFSWGSEHRGAWAEIPAMSRAASLPHSMPRGGERADPAGPHGTYPSLPRLQQFVCSGDSDRRGFLHRVHTASGTGCLLGRELVGPFSKKFPPGLLDERIQGVAEHGQLGVC